MYAFAVWHERHQQLALVRDRMGVKPLYYRQTADGVLFGSEPKVILANPLAPAIVDLDGLPELFPETRAPGGSPWKDIAEVEPGSVLTVTRTGLRRRTYWTLPTRAHDDDTGTTVQTVRELLADIVRRQLVSDVPLCLLLSGGLDSSSITALAAEQQRANGRLRTFSVDFVDRASVFRPSALHPSLDTPYATEVANHVESRHTNITLQLDDLTDPALRRAVIVARDMPGQGQGDASLHQLFAAVRHDSAVALSGESADEVFGGYRWFHDPDARESPTFPWLTWHADMHASDGPFVSMLRPERAAQLDIEARTADQYARARRAVDHLDHTSPLERRMREISYLALTHFVRTWLDRKDRMSMAVGLEVRVPFCDHRLVEYVYNAPWSMKTFDGREKSLLRQAVKELLPRSVVQRRKSGYPAMVDPRYGIALQNQAKDVLAEPQHPVFSLVSRPWLQKAVAMDPGDVIRSELAGVSLALDLYHWLDIYRPTLVLD
jgi:asparagine synthase (glutamine-hydrolysing)